LKTNSFSSFDGVKLAVHEMGEGRPLLLLHGLFSHADMNWIKFGHAAKLAESGYRVIMPDFRAHGQSDAPHDPAAYPQDVLVTDILALLDHLAFEDFDLGGFSLGARITAKLLCEGVKPRRALLMGMGWEGLQGWDSRRQFFIDAIKMSDTVTRSDPHFMAVQFFKSQKIDPVAALLMLGSFGPMQADKLTEVDVPIAVVCGVDDRDNGSAPLLAEKLADAEYTEIPGTHMSSVTEDALGDAMIAFLGTHNE
jgi:pimeloyl-ACP methyl ester carboxylesterase